MHQRIEQIFSIQFVDSWLRQSFTMIETISFLSKSKSPDGSNNWDHLQSGFILDVFTNKKVHQFSLFKPTQPVYVYTKHVMFIRTNNNHNRVNIVSFWRQRNILSINEISRKERGSGCNRFLCSSPTSY
nr:MAG TPA: hypothetical protein [Caudoviricetes sp.]